MSTIRPAAVAGAFYPGDTTTLTRQVDDLLAAVARSPSDEGWPKALIVPHAGYIYSGPVAGHAYRELEKARSKVRRVVLLGPVHRVPVRGLALPGVDAFETPLGRVPVDADAMKALSGLPQVTTSRAAHAHEHSLEVQLPFLQRVLEHFAVVPLAVGAATKEEVAQTLERIWGGPETLIVLSTDLSHYHPYEEARRIDGATLERIAALKTDIVHDEACGATPLNGLLLAARRRGMRVRLLAACNSGDTAGDREGVVGYSAFALEEAKRAADREDVGRTLVGVARGSIVHRLGLGEAPRLDVPAWLVPPAATFVTLTYEARLRGCIGSLEARRPLGVDVAENACNAAFRDPRFHALAREEWPRCAVEVSLLSPLAAIEFRDEAELMGSIVPGEDGLVLRFGSCQGTFLPQVWEGLPDTRDFLRELKRKAGVPADTPLERCRVLRYRVEKWREADFVTH
jgi:AmmeMemoRadiSam system protein B/AmmeMemoRadiSam system protein A